MERKGTRVDFDRPGDFEPSFGLFDPSLGLFEPSLGDFEPSFVPSFASDLCEEDEGELGAPDEVVREIEEPSFGDLGPALWALPPGDLLPLLTTILRGLRGDLFLPGPANERM